MLVKFELRWDDQKVDVDYSDRLIADDKERNTLRTSETGYSSIKVKNITGKTATTAAETRPKISPWSGSSKLCN